ncbi:hypothetical protein BT96DRAFT_816965, partial [Gymnopus androsaceus JB14]
YFKLTKLHTGEYLAERVTQLLKDYGLTLLVLGMTLDNASNNNALLKSFLISFHPQPLLLCCTRSTALDTFSICVSRCSSLCLMLPKRPRRPRPHSVM